MGILSTSALVSCDNSGGTASANSTESVERMKKVNVWTTNISSSFQTMLNSDKRFRASNAKPPKPLDLELFWMALHSSMLNMERTEKMLTEHPTMTEEIRNLWNARVEWSFNEIEKSGLLEKMDGPLTSRLGEAFGEERVETDIVRIMKSAHSIQAQLGITAESGQSQ